MLVSNVLIELVLVADSLLLIYIKKKLNSEHVKVQINVFHIYTQYIISTSKFKVIYTLFVTNARL